MKRPYLLLLLLCLALFISLVSAGEQNRSDQSSEYVVGQFAIFSFSDEISPEETASSSGNSNASVQNETRRSGEMTARKLFELKQAARDDFRSMGNVSLELSTGLSPTAAQSFSIVCKQCVPKKTTI